jgi:hypothetical protein
MKLKDLITNCLFKAYYPYIIRKEKFVAVRMWRKGVKQCEKMYNELGSPRVYLFFDRKHMVWAPMTYEPNKQLKPSFKVLRRMGKMHGMHKIQNVEDMKNASYYYTPSKWGAIGCDEDNRVRTEKLAQWLSYYLNFVSEPMRKCHLYLRRQARRRPEGAC